MKPPQIGCLAEVKKKKKWTVSTMRESDERKAREIDSFPHEKATFSKTSTFLRKGIGRKEWIRKALASRLVEFLVQTIFFSSSADFFFPINLEKYLVFRKLFALKDEDIWTKRLDLITNQEDCQIIYFENIQRILGYLWDVFRISRS